MALTRRLIELPWTQQPQDAAPGYGGELCAGLEFLFHAPLAPLELARGIAGTVGAGGVSVGVGAFGRRISGGNAQSGHILFPTPLASSAYTVAAVVRDHTQGTLRSVFDADGNTGRVFQLRLTASNTLEFIPFNTGGSPSVAQSTATVSPTSLHVLAATVDANKLASVYVNGVQSGTTATLSGSVQTFASGQQPAVGNSAHPIVNTYYPGDIYLVAYWTRALSAIDIADFARNPWRLFEPQRIWVPVSAAGGGTGNAAGATFVSTAAFTGGAATAGAEIAGASFASTFAFAAGAASVGVAGNASGAAFAADFSFTAGAASAGGTANAPGAAFNTSFAFAGGAATGLQVGDAPGASFASSFAFSGGAAAGGGPVTAPGATFEVAAGFYGGNAYIPGQTVIPQVSIYITAGVSLVLPAAP